MPTFAGRLIPIVAVKSLEYALLVPSLIALLVKGLRQMIASIVNDRERMLAALDYLFLGF
jgi:hypothetical protein